MKKCPYHPKYKALRKPRADCEICHIIWYLKSFPQIRKNIEQSLSKMIQKAYGTSI